jgi:integrase
MATNQLSDLQIRKAKPKDKEYLLTDGQCLYLRVRPDGSKDWMFIYRFGPEGKKRKISFGSLDDLPLASARLRRNECRESIKQGIDPQLLRDQREAEQEAQRQAMAAHNVRLTVKELFLRWERVELSARKDGGKEVRRSFEKDVLTAIGDMAAEDVKRATIAAILDAVVERGARILARNLLGDLRQMFGFAVKRDLVENDPTSHLKRSDYGTKQERERVLSEAEIKTLRRTLPAAKMTKTNQLVLWIQLGTGCRIGEILQARWEHINLDAGTWRIPSETAKNAKEHTIALSEFALEQFKALNAITATKKNEKGESVPCTWVIPARQPDNHVDLKTVSKQVADRQRGDKEAMSNRSANGNALALPGGKWTPHDLRRTAATMMVQLGAAPDVVEKCLNHVEQNRMKRIYQRHDYAAEMKQAWRLLGQRLDLLTRVDADNVVTMPPKAA